ncbi:MAG TPA: hypothetical protein VKL19_04995 [Thermoanaerobaculia bacterium]|nr:hypothetical protein [Thermoanaerobaculia bacterium]
MIDFSPRYSRAIDAIHELLSKLRIEWVFVGGIARAAWLGGVVEGGSIDVVALMQPQQKGQVAMMASNRGFRVDREEIERSEELDLIPLHFDDVRIHVLVASNALYAKMIAAARVVGQLKVASPEDLALLLTLSEDSVGVQQLMSSPDFDRARYNDTLTSIGLRELVR